MKMFVVLSSLVFAAVAQATPAVGDKVSFSGTWGSDAVSQTLAFVAFNGTEYKKVTTTKIGVNAAQTAEEWVNKDDTASDAALQDIVTNCANYGGKPETITVPAGTFPTCKAPMQSGGTMNIGVVPFAIVRVDTFVDGKALTMTLGSFARGQ